MHILILLPTLCFTIILIIILSVYTYTSDTYAAAWNLEKENSQLIITNSFYQTEEFFDKTNNRQKQPEFTKFESDLLYEYGYNDFITLGLHPRLQRISQDIADDTLTDFGIASIDTLIRVGVYEKINLFYEGDSIVASVQPLLKLSPSSNGKDFSVSSDQWDIELRVLAGYSFKYLDYYHFINTELGYRLREGMPSDEVFFDGTLGIRFNNYYMFLGQIFYTSSIKEGTNKGVSLANPLDFELTKLQFSIVKEFNKKYSLQLGVFKNIDGENTGVGNGGLISLWVNF